MSEDSIAFNEDELAAPKWLDSALLRKIIQNCEMDSRVKVKDFQISPATVKGDHYASIMFKVKLVYQIEKNVREKSLIIKIMPEEECDKKEFLKGAPIFETEIAMYTEVLPMFERILKKSGDNTKLSTSCIYHSVTPKKLIAFEDLTVKGYKVLRNRSMSKEEALCAYAKLAKWHAVSMKILHEDPKYFDDFRFGMFALDQESPIFKNGFKYFLELLESDETLCQYKKYFDKYRDNLFEKCKESCLSFRENARNDTCYVLCHGDFHLKNVMMKYKQKTGEFEDLIPIDFQVAFVGPNHIDLIYSFYLMLDSDLRIGHSDELIFEYHSVLINTLRNIGFKGSMPKLADLRNQMLRDKYWEIFMMSSFLPLWLSVKSGGDVALIMSSEEHHRATFHNAEFINQLKIILPIFLHRGYLES